MKRVEVGQVYKDADYRSGGQRTLQVTKVQLVTNPKSKKGNYGCAAEFADCDVYRNGVKTGTTRIHTARMMKKTSSGYELLDIHALPKREFEVQIADMVMNAIAELAESSASDISTNFRYVQQLADSYRKERERA